ncbi:homeobox domain-containing protein [Endozoicomonas sp. ONNA2]|uniref:homeobox domain-containing protein n=1 Tax=Endozoicomonas sp. ONNA2 TaxID=2828741 RepID=UPI0021486952|nr:homeobox domain-containing protein [Endozoicomonas sp. ONNA2]
MDPLAPSKYSSYMLPGAASSSKTCEPARRPASFGGRLSEVRSTAQPFFSYLPERSQVGNNFKPYSFGSIVSNMSYVPTHLSPHGHPAMTPIVIPDYPGHPEVADIGMSSVYGPGGSTATHTKTVDEGEDSCLLDSVKKIATDTTESHSPKACSETKKRKPRTIFSEWQTQELIKVFKRAKHLSTFERSVLASKLQLPELSIRIWFQNRRSSKRNEVIAAGLSNISGKRMVEPDPNESDFTQAGPEPGVKERKKRTSYSVRQINLLNQAFQRCPYIDGEPLSLLAAELGLTHTQVKNWFKNKRAKCRKHSVESAQGNQSSRPLIVVPLVACNPFMASVPPYSCHGYVPFGHPQTAFPVTMPTLSGDFGYSGEPAADNELNSSSP